MSDGCQVSQSQDQDLRGQQEVRRQQQLTLNWASLQMILYLVRRQKLSPQGEIHRMGTGSTRNIDIRKKLILVEDSGSVEVKWDSHHEEPLLCMQPNTQPLISCKGQKLQNNRPLLCRWARGAEAAASPGRCCGSRNGCRLSCDWTEQTGSASPALPVGRAQALTSSDWR